MLSLYNSDLNFREKKLYSTFERALESFEPSSLVSSWWFHGYLKWRLAHSSTSIHPSSGVIIQPYIHLHDLSPFLPLFSFVVHVLSLCSCVFGTTFSFSSNCSSPSLCLVWCILFSSTLIQFSCLLIHFVRFIIVLIQFYSVLLIFTSFCWFNLTIWGTSIWVWIWC